MQCASHMPACLGNHRLVYMWALMFATAVSYPVLAQTPQRGLPRHVELVT